MSGTGGVDASIPLQAGRGTTQPENPLQALGNVANTANALNQLKLFPGQQQLQQQAVQGGAVAIANQINQAAWRAMVPTVLGNRDGFTLSDLTSAAGSAENNLHIPTQGIVSDVASLSQTPNTPEWRQAVIARAAAMSQETGAGAVAQVTPGAGPPVTYGGAGTGLPPTIQPTVVNPAGLGAPGVVRSAGAGFPIGLSPGENASPHPGPVNPATGAPSVITGSEFLRQAGGEPSPFTNGGRIMPPAALRNPNGPAVTSVPSRPPGIQTGLGTAESSALAGQGAASNSAFQNITDAGVAARTQGALIDNLMADASQFTSGPLADTLLKINQYRREFGLTPDEQSTTAQQAYNKLVNQLADAQSSRSDKALGVNQAANPNASLTPEGIQMIGAQLRGNADYLMARQQLAEPYSNKSDNRGFEANVASNLDPRVFQYARMTPQQKMAFYRSMPNKAEFQKSYYWSQAHNLLPPAIPVAAPAAPVSAVAPSIPTNE